MALHLLNPGLRPLGLFDLEDDVELEGGEYVGLADQTGTAAADSANQGPFTNDDLDTGVMVSVGASAAGSWGGLADDGSDEYGTLFGGIIGANAGQATAESGVVVIGPQTTLGSGKVTVWAQQGLYGISGAAADTALTGLDAGNLCRADANGHWADGTTPDGTEIGYCLGHMTDQSLVSTTNLAAGEDQEIAHSVVYYQGVKLSDNT